MSMRLDKRGWLYGGLDLPPGLALVSRPRRAILQPPARIVLLGGRAASGLGPPLARLAASAGSTVLLATDEVLSPALAAAARALKPEGVLVAAPPIQFLAEALAGLRHAWVPASTFPSFSGRPHTATWYASWAASVWGRLIKGELLWQS